MSPMPLKSIADRRTSITRELDRLKSEYDAQVAALETERQELEIAARVFQRLGVTADPPLPFLESRGRGSQEPFTLPDRIIAIVRESMAAGLDGATSRDILTALDKRWGDHDPNNVRPTLWRMVRDERLTKSEEGFYAIADD